MFKSNEVIKCCTESVRMSFIWCNFFFKILKYWGVWPVMTWFVFPQILTVYIPHIFCCGQIWQGCLSWVQSMMHALPLQYGPLTMILPASGHQVRCIPWLPMGTLNKEMGFLCGFKFFALNVFCGEYPQSSLHLMLQIWWKPLLWKMCQ